jgi:hypothetical protein
VKNNKEKEVIDVKERKEEMEKMVDELRFWGSIILSGLSYPEDDPLYSCVEYVWKHPEAVGVDSEELTVIANSQVDDEDLESVIEEFYSILREIAEKNEEVIG